MPPRRLRLSASTALLALSLAAASTAAVSTATAQQITLVKDLPTEGNTPYVQNRPPLAPAPLIKLPIGAIQPGGWLAEQLRLEADGMGGRLDEVSRFVKFEGNGWIDPKAKGGWEELPYWLKGLGDLAYVTGDPALNAKAKRWIEGILATQENDGPWAGWFGPEGLKTALDGKPDLWPHMPVLAALQSYHEHTGEHTGDKRVLQFMTNYFRWLNAQPPETFSLGYWPRLRWGDCLYSVHWLYNRTGDAFLLELAQKMHANSAKWSDGVINGHNVNFAQGFREPTQFAVQSKDPALRQQAYKNYDLMMAEYGQFPGGGFAADENTRKGFTDPRQGFETCGIVEFMNSFELLHNITGDPLWAERNEDLAFNSLPAALTPDAKGLHYLTCANQVVLDRGNKSPGIQNRGTMFSYSPGHVYRCCQHNHTMGWPYYAEHLYLATADGGLLANLYGASTVTAKVGPDAREVRLTQTTNYPFEEDIRLKLSIPGNNPLRFPLYLRIPSWATFATTVNGQPIPITSQPGYVKLEHDWKDGDEVTLHLGMQVTRKTWAKNHNAVSIHYGPLAFAYSPGETWTAVSSNAVSANAAGTNPAWPDHEVRPVRPFNYGLDAATIVTAELKVDRKPGPLAAQPFTPETAPLSIRIPARQIPEWKLDENELLRPLQPGPAKTAAPLETITLIPMGAARLRISTFPLASPSADAVTWKDPPPAPRVSYCYSGDSPAALTDGLIPQNSDDHSIPRLTFWSHKGTTEWVELKTDPAAEVSSVSVYWFDDSPRRGGCRLPASWRLLYLDGTTWKPIDNVTLPEIAADRFNRATFPPIKTTAIRIELQLKKSFSAGILEVQLNDKQATPPTTPPAAPPPASR